MPERSRATRPLTRQLGKYIVGEVVKEESKRDLARAAELGEEVLSTART